MIKITQYPVSCHHSLLHINLTSLHLLQGLNIIFSIKNNPNSTMALMNTSLCAISISRIRV